MKPWLSVIGPGDTEEERAAQRMTLDVRASDFDFLTSLAAYRNTLARLQGKKLRKQWSRKQLAENFISAQVDAMKEQLSAMLKACGDLPTYDPDDEASRDAMEAFVKKVIAWDAKHSK